MRFLLSNAKRNGSVNQLQSVLPEQMFLRTLCLERKRAERSRKLFVLMLLDPGLQAQNGNGANVLNKTVGGLLSSIRETDVVGWYKEHSRLGVIFAELGAGDKKAILTTLHAKVTAVLRANLDMKELNHVHISFFCFPDDADEHDRGLPSIAPLYPDLVQPEPGRFSLALKRAIDVVGSAMALIILAPLMLIVAVAIKLSSPGPVLFRQARIGQYDVPFTFLKFRSMHAVNDSRIHQEYVKQFIAGAATPRNGDAPNGAVYKITADPRVTRIGQFLRKTSLDEVPQFFNVLMGQMSLVGPRPPIPYELEAYDVWHRRRLLVAKPGITGLWQVSGRSRLQFDDMVRLDLKYAKAWSVWGDLKILLQTPRAVVSGRGAY